MRTTISTKGQIVLPAELRRRDRVEPGQAFEIERIDDGAYRLTRVAPQVTHGLVSWLRACPEKGYFEPIDSASTDTLEPHVP